MSVIALCYWRGKSVHFYFTLSPQLTNPWPVVHLMLSGLITYLSIFPPFPLPSMEFLRSTCNAVVGSKSMAGRICRVDHFSLGCPSSAEADFILPPCLLLIDHAKATVNAASSYHPVESEGYLFFLRPIPLFYHKNKGGNGLKHFFVVCGCHTCQ